MGSCLSQEPDVDFDGPVDFNHFNILRAIGKGAFGKVCIVKKRDTKQMYAMKYMNKVQIIHKHAVENVFREIKILQCIEHNFVVNLWFTFQDREDIFMVLDLMLGGDLSYHLEKEGRFQVPRVRLYIAELSLALEYLREKCIIHRDIKPANMLLDSQGHIHLTDFNVACFVRGGAAITSVTGTKPYMAPEIFRPPSNGYSYAVDWWSLGVSSYEMLRGQRPFSMERHMTNEDMFSQLSRTRPSASARWDAATCDVLKLLLHPDEDKRLQHVSRMKELYFFQHTLWDEVSNKTAEPPFVPPQNRINCDPTHELEEMIVEPNPLHKKQHRLSKRNFKNEDEVVETELEKIQARFKAYNRVKAKETSDCRAEHSAEDTNNQINDDSLKLKVDEQLPNHKSENELKAHSEEPSSEKLDKDPSSLQSSSDDKTEPSEKPPDDKQPSSEEPSDDKHPPSKELSDEELSPSPVDKPAPSEESSSEQQPVDKLSGPGPAETNSTSIPAVASSNSSKEEDTILSCSNDQKALLSS